jgi:small subunit ribosomal protein S28e
MAEEEIKKAEEKKPEETKAEQKESRTQTSQDAKKEAPKMEEAEVEKKQKKDYAKQESKSEKSKSTASVEGAVPAQVVKVFKKVGLYGESYQVLARILEGRDQGNLLRRNVRGPVKENDILMLKETERDVRAV